MGVEKGNLNYNSLYISLLREYWIIDYSESKDYLTKELRISVGYVTT